MNTIIRPLKGYKHYYLKVIQEVYTYRDGKHLFTEHSYPGKRTVYLFNNKTGEEQLLYKFLDFITFTPEDVEEEAICLIENKVFTRHLALKMK